MPPQIIACSPKRSVSVSSLKVDSIIAEREEPIAEAKPSAVFSAKPDAS